MVADCPLVPCTPGTCISILRRYRFHVGGCILYLCMLISPCAAVPSACCAPFEALGVSIVVDDSSQVVHVLLCVCMRSVVDCGSTGLSNQDCLLRSHVKINCHLYTLYCMSAQLFCTGQLSTSCRLGLTQSPCNSWNVLLCTLCMCTTGITTVYTLVF